MRYIYVFSFILQVVGPKLMENRKPFNLRYTLILYNFIQVIFSAWLFYEVSASFYQLFYKFFMRYKYFSNSLNQFE